MRKDQNITGTCLIIIALVLCFQALPQAEAADAAINKPYAEEPDPDYPMAAAAFDTLYTKYKAFLGTKAGSIQTNTYGLCGHYYTQWFDNGMALAAWVDGYVYLLYGGTWQSLNTIWQSEIASVYLIFNTLIYQYSSFFGSPSTTVFRGTISGQNYYSMYFTNGIVLVAATDGDVYYYLSSTWTPLGITWKTF